MNSSTIKRDKILVDANVLIALAYPRDPHHNQASVLLETLKINKPMFVTNNHIIDEALTVTPRRAKSMVHAILLGNSVYEKEASWFRVFRVPLSWEQEAFNLFRSQETYKKDTFLSFTDCILITQARKQRLTTLFTFDETLKKFEREGIKILC